MPWIEVGHSSEGEYEKRREATGPCNYNTLTKLDIVPDRTLVPLKAINNICEWIMK